MAGRNLRSDKVFFAAVGDGLVQSFGAGVIAVELFDHVHRHFAGTKARHVSPSCDFDQAQPHLFNDAACGTVTENSCFKPSCF